MIFHLWVNAGEEGVICQDNALYKAQINDECCSSFTYNVSSAPHVFLFYEHYKYSQITSQTKEVFFSFSMLWLYLLFILACLCTAMLKTWEYQLWFDIRPGAAGVLKAEGHSINPMKNMFTGKQNVINPTIYQVFDRKQNPAGISLTSVSCDANGQKSWNHSLERRGGIEGESQGGSN